MKMDLFNPSENLVLICFYFFLLHIFNTDVVRYNEYMNSCTYIYLFSNMIRTIATYMITLLFLLYLIQNALHIVHSMTARYVYNTYFIEDDIDKWDIEERLRCWYGFYFM